MTDLLHKLIYISAKVPDWEREIDQEVWHAKQVWRFWSLPNRASNTGMWGNSELPGHMVYQPGVWRGNNTHCGQLGLTH